jgi:divalent metal cation (Fe/Co/Zn/Cd) transporter
MAVVTGDPRWDGVGAMSVGILLVVIAVFLAFEMSSMLIGEGALPEEQAAIEAALSGTPGVESIVHARTLHTGPDELLVAAKVAVSPSAAAEDLAVMIDAAERNIRGVASTARWIYIEPDIRRAAGAAGEPARGAGEEPPGA